MKIFGIVLDIYVIIFKHYVRTNISPAVSVNINLKRKSNKLKIPHTMP